MAMKAYLVQHAKALAKQQDPDRPLTDEGRAELSRVAAFAAHSGQVHIGRIWNSGKTRAAQSAQILADALMPPLGVRSAEEMDPGDPPHLWGERLPEMSQDVMLVGHMPHLSRLASLLLTGDPEREAVRFENGGIVCLEYDGQRWSLGWAVTPSLIPADG
jgi:phosphohistidine phosphatase